MGQQDVDQGQDAAQLRAFSQHLLTDLRVLQHMLEEDLLERGVRRIGAEQEIFLVDQAWQPAPANMEILKDLDDPHFTTELGRFNLEFNLDPLEFRGDVLRRLEEDLKNHLERLQAVANTRGVELLLTGILPTLDKSHLHLGNMTPVPRYYALNEAMNRMRGEEYFFRIEGRDQLIVTHDNVMLEACNTSFQLHLQVDADDFARLYNIAQAVAAPVLAGATNSPLLFGHQLWRETRIALFEQSVDTRTPTSHPRHQVPRVSFGRQWVEESALEIFQEDISRFRVLISVEIEEDPVEVLNRGEAPRLDALRLHNGTVYRWNRPCYGVSNGRPHLRIENRVVPAGPTVIDEVANAAFWYGLMAGLPSEIEDVTEVMDFNVAKENLLAAARLGLGAQMTWPGMGTIGAAKLILRHLLPIAEAGLRDARLDGEDVDRYLGVIEERISTQKTGSQWLVDSLAQLKPKGPQSEVLAAIVAACSKRQQKGDPVHTWKPARRDEAPTSTIHYATVAQLMTTDLFTVNEEDVVDMVAAVMKWRHIRRIPVEDNRHRLVGLVTYRSLLRFLSEILPEEGDTKVPVRRLMATDLVTVRPETPTLEALRLMRERKIGCLPVVDKHEHLVGILTEHDLIEIAWPLLERYLKGDDQGPIPEPAGPPK